MKTLLLLRHAKYRLNDPMLSDEMRPLTIQGKNEIHFIGKILKNKNIIPDLMISSTAKRATETSTILAKDINYNNEIQLSKLLYQTTAKEYINIINKVSDKYNTVLLVGHNPTLENVVEIITNELRIMKTCSLAFIVLSVNSWTQIQIQTKGKLIELYDVTSLG